MTTTSRRLLLLTALTASLALAAGAAFAQAPEYQVTIYNLTAAQPISPPVVATHSNDIALIHVGEPVGPEFIAMAEDGDPMPLAGLLASMPQVEDVAAAGGPVPPGGSTTLTVHGDVPFHRISAVGMLVNTNDAFFALDTVTAPRKRYQSLTFFAPAFDAGSEVNNEDCDFIPGPACNAIGAFVRDPMGAEGFVHIHRGIHGTGDLDAGTYDWHNPVVKIVITRVR